MRRRNLQIRLRGIRVIIKGVGEDKENVKFARERKVNINKLKRIYYGERFTGIERVKVFF